MCGTRVFYTAYMQREKFRDFNDIMRLKCISFKTKASNALPLKGCLNYS